MGIFQFYWLLVAGAKFDNQTPDTTDPHTKSIFFFEYIYHFVVEINKIEFQCHVTHNK